MNEGRFPLRALKCAAILWPGSSLRCIRRQMGLSWQCNRHHETSAMTHKDRTTLDYLRPGTEDRVRARENFRLTDADGDKQITFDEFVTFMADFDPGMSADELRIGFDEIDSDHDGVISFDEFRSWLQS